MSLPVVDRLTKFKHHSSEDLITHVQLTMAARGPPSLYKDPPSFDIELDEFRTLPLRRLEIFRQHHLGTLDNERGANSPQTLSEGAIIAKSG